MIRIFVLEVEAPSGAVKLDMTLDYDQAGGALKVTSKSPEVARVTFGGDSRGDLATHVILRPVERGPGDTWAIEARGQRAPFSGTRACLECGSLGGWPEPIVEPHGSHEAYLVDGWRNSFCCSPHSDKWFARNRDTEGCKYCGFVHGLTQEQCAELRARGLRGP